MVLSYDYSNRNRRQRRTNSPPSRAISMDMAVHLCNTERIARCSMTRASLEATGRRHRAITRSVSPQRQPRRPINTTMMQHVPTLLPTSMAIAMQRYNTKCIARRRRFVAFVKATKCHHRASTRADRHQSDMPTPILGAYFIVKLSKKGSSCPNNNRGMTHQTDEKNPK